MGDPTPRRGRRRHGSDAVSPMKMGSYTGGTTPPRAA